MTGEEIRKQMMSSAGINDENKIAEEEPKPETTKEVTYKGTIEADNLDAEAATPESIREFVQDDDLRGYFLILNGCGEEFYMQAITVTGTPDSSQGFGLEYREGSGDEHFRTSKVLNHDEVEKALLKYASGDQSFKNDFEWERIHL